MPCFPFKTADGVVGIACGRTRARKCFTCDAPNASLSCDGCDHVLCTACAVSPARELDFCPACFAPVWQHWLKLGTVPSSRPERRQAFRLWARENSATFLQFAKPRTKTSIAEVGGPT